MSLLERLTARIAAEGPISVADYMTACLHDPTDGYYATRPALGAAGDFITAPHVSQIFGELLGLWAAEVWTRLGAPPRIRLVELGPGDGTMMGDMLRAARAAPAFLAACEPWLVETSPPLRALQAAALPTARSAETLDALPTDAPMIILANEFLDCLPIRQWVDDEDGWMERRVGLGADGGLAFVSSLRRDRSMTEPPSPLWGGSAPRVAPRSARPRAGSGRGGEVRTTSSAGEASDFPTPIAPRSSLPMMGREGKNIHETSDALEAMGRSVGGLIAQTTGAALFIDYGRDAPGSGDTLQALRGHAKESPLANPGLADLTAHVDFPAFLAAGAGAGAVASTIRTQGDFLRALGAPIRAAALRQARPDRADQIARQLDRLISPDQMGALFKVACLHSPGLAPPGFETAR